MPMVRPFSFKGMEQKLTRRFSGGPDRKRKARAPWASSGLSSCSRGSTSLRLSGGAVSTASRRDETLRACSTKLPGLSPTFLLSPGRSSSRLTMSASTASSTASSTRSSTFSTESEVAMASLIL
jgi:hypothetical protein